MHLSNRMRQPFREMVIELAGDYLCAENYPICNNDAAHKHVRAVLNKGRSA
jgi:hypothetical protein